ncbi:dimethyladenosine transferase 2, mitochondrial [Malaya genurostris]|uniref:dimethyladenosine transferase 2, mitochondrial n=1 Tax=Malaya genurostris TaxID=325434 RepID=UPI0026F3A2EB|nr:dimethyladenosine transferase 2, mitochondrial [Malaya genurostris]
MHSRLPVINILFKRNIAFDIARRQLACEPLKRKKSTVEEPTGSTSTKTIGKRAHDEIKKYFTSIGNESILKKIPPELLMRHEKHLERFYISTSQCAELVAKHVTAGLSPDMILAEINPGPGLLTRELVKCDVKKLLLIESEDCFESDLKRLMATHTRCDWNVLIAHFNGICKYSYQNRGIKLEQLIAGGKESPRKQMPDGVNLRLFSTVDSLKFFKSLIGSVISQTGLFSYVEWEMMLVIPPLLFEQLTCDRTAGYAMFRKHTVLFQIFFEYELLARIPRNHLLPWPPRSMKRKPYRTRKRYELEHADEWFLVRVVPRRNVSEFCPPEDWHAFEFFLSQSLASRANRIVPTMEQWIPFCGVRLIINRNYVPHQPISEAQTTNELQTFHRTSTPLRKNDLPERISIFTEFGELTPSQMISLFNEFRNWPEYRQSQFLTMLEQHDRKGHSVNDGKSVTAAGDASEVDVEQNAQPLKGRGKTETPDVPQ